MIEKLEALLYKAARDVASGRDVKATLTGKGFTHILMSYSGFNVWIKEEAVTDHDRQVLRPFFETHTQMLFLHGRVWPAANWSLMSKFLVDTGRH